MIDNLSPRDWQEISAYLDNQLNPKARAQLEKRLENDPAMQDALEELRYMRAVLRSQPRLRAPRNFTLTPKMVPQRPLPAAFPLLRLATVMASLLFVVLLAGELLGRSAMLQPETAMLRTMEQAAEAQPAAKSIPPQEQAAPAVVLQAPEPGAAEAGAAAPFANPAYDSAIAASPTLPALAEMLTEIEETPVPPDESVAVDLPTATGELAAAAKLISPEPSQFALGAPLAGTPTPSMEVLTFMAVPMTAEPSEVVKLPPAQDLPGLIATLRVEKTRRILSAGEEALLAAAEATAGAPTLTPTDTPTPTETPGDTPTLTGTPAPGTPTATPTDTPTITPTTVPTTLPTFTPPATPLPPEPTATEPFPAHVQQETPAGAEPALPAAQPVPETSEPGIETSAEQPAETLLHQNATVEPSEPEVGIALSPSESQTPFTSLAPPEPSALPGSPAPTTAKETAMPAIESVAPTSPTEPLGPRVFGLDQRLWRGLETLTLLIALTAGVAWLILRRRS